MQFFHLVSFCLLLLLFVTINAENPNREKTKKLLHKAINEYKKNGFTNWAPAKAIFKKIFEIDPDYGEARQKYAHGIAAMEHDYDKALPEYVKCVKSFEKRSKAGPLTTKEKASLVECLSWAGVSYRRTGNIAAGIPYLQKAVKVDPYFLSGWYNLGYSLHSVFRYKEALDAYTMRLLRKPFSREQPGGRRRERSQATENIGLIAMAAERWETAILSLNYAIRLHEEEVAKTHFQTGYCYMKMNKLKIAEQHFKEAGELDSSYSQQNLQHLMRTISNTITEYKNNFSKKFKKNIDKIFDGVDKKLNSIPVQFFYMVNDQQLAYWNSSVSALGTIDEFCRILYQQTRDFDPKKRKEETSLMSLNPFNTCRLPFTLQQSLSIARSYGQYVLPETVRKYPQTYNVGKLRKRFNARPGNRIKVGFISSDIRRHPVYQVVRGVFEYYDRKKFEVIVYILYRDELVLDQVRQWVDKVVDVEHLSQKETIDAIRGDNIEVLVDLNLYTGEARPAMMANHLAPVVINYCGYPGTSGASWIDYIITDPMAVPPALSIFYSEKILYLPHTWLINNHRSAHSKILDPVYLKKTVSRKKYGLPEKKIIFASFCQHYKIDKQLFDTWCHIMHNVPNSVMWLIKYALPSDYNVKKEFLACGIDPSKRVVFTPKIPDGEHIAAATLADLFLDTPKYNGGMTSVDTLWAGVPMVTLPGDQQKIVQRMGASLSVAVEMPEMIVSTYEEYGKRAIELGNHPKLLNRLRKKLEKKRMTAPLFDSKQSAADLMEAIRLAWDNYINEKESTIIYVREPKRGSQNLKTTKKEKKRTRGELRREKYGRKRKKKNEL